MNIDCPSGVRLVKYNTPKAILEASTAKVWIDNVRASHLTKKKPSQIYLQTWHGSFSPKLLEKDAETKLTKYYVKKAKYDGKITDGILSNSSLLDEQYERAFWLNKKTEILKFGLPRNDILFEKGSYEIVRKKIRLKYSINDDDYVVLYAPTFRDDNSTEGYTLSFQDVIKAFEEKTQKKICLLVRFHPNVRNYGILQKNENQTIDVTKYPDLQELVIASDAVISDYSTTIFDFALIKKPVFLLSLDIEDYQKMRGLMPIYYSFPFPFSKTNEQLIKNILDFSYENYNEQLTSFFSKHPIYDKGVCSFVRIKN